MDHFDLTKMGPIVGHCVSNSWDHATSLCCHLKTLPIVRPQSVNLGASKRKPKTSHRTQLSRNNLNVGGGGMFCLVHLKYS